jgi:hypothetical protein
MYYKDENSKDFGCLYVVYRLMRTPLKMKIFLWGENFRRAENYIFY